jgi:hypothetical protein
LSTQYSDNHLLIFARMPELGRVKTRLAHIIGEAAALMVYQELLACTRSAAASFEGQKTVWLTQPDAGPLVPAAVAAEWPGYAWQPQPLRPVRWQLPLLVPIAPA